MRRRAIAGLAWLLQYKLLQMAIHGLRSSSIEATYIFEFLGEHVQLTKQPAVEKITKQGPVSHKT